MSEEIGIHCNNKDIRYDRCPHPEIPCETCKESPFNLVAGANLSGKLAQIRLKKVKQLEILGVLPTSVDDTQSHHVGESDYSHRVLQPWHIWQAWELNPWDADIVKRVLRNKKTDTRRMDYEKIIHVCQERIRQIDEEES